MEEWNALYRSKSGERGIFNRVAAQLKAGASTRREPHHDFGTNPCGEIILRPNGLCNLSEVVVRNGDSREELLRKVKLATIIGTFQSTLTNFRYLRKIWQKNAEEERLLGVSLTGIMDHPILSGRLSAERDIEEWSEYAYLEDVLNELRDYAIEVNREWAGKLGINPAAADT